MRAACVRRPPRARWGGRTYDRCRLLLLSRLTGPPTRMSSIRFNHVFAALLLLSVLSAFVIPERYTVRLQPQVQSLFYPVARPVGALAGWIAGRAAKDEKKDTRDPQAVINENQELRQELAATFTALEELKRRNEERDRVGPIREFCT